MTHVRLPISVGFPVYNGQRYLREALDSILCQTFPDFEVVISDNASTDATREICEEYRRRDSRIRYMRQETNIGASGNWNFVFARSTGRYFKWASSNDICHPEMLDRCKEVLDQHPDVVLCYPKTRLIDEAGAIVEDYVDTLHLPEENAGERFINLLLKIRLNNAQNGLIRAKWLRRTAMEGSYEAGDIPLMAELALYGKYFEFPEYLFLRRISPGASSTLLGKAGLRLFINPASRSRVHMPAWRYCFDLFRAVYRSPLSMGEKLKLDGFLVKYSYWHRRSLWRNLSTLRNLVPGKRESGR